MDAPRETWRFLDYDTKSKRARTMFGQNPPKGRDAIRYVRGDVVEVLDAAARAVCEQYPAGDLSQAMIELQKAVKAMEGE